MDTDDFAEVYRVTREFLDKHKQYDGGTGVYYVRLTDEDEEKEEASDRLRVCNRTVDLYPYTLDHLYILKDLGLIYFEITKPYFTEIHIDIPFRWVEIDELGA